jgi:hypothetical protein
VWNSDGTVEGKTLMEQLYPGDEDIVSHFNYIKRAIEDKRYLRIDNKPVFVVYKPLLHPDVRHFMDMWNKMIKESGIAEAFFFIAHTVNHAEFGRLKGLGFDAINIVRNGEYRYNKSVVKRIPFELFKFKVLKRPLVLKYSFISKYFIDEKTDKDEYIIPTLIPNWDHTPRSGNGGSLFHNSTPQLFKKHVKKALEVIKNKKPTRQVLFLKSWNEWGEGNYMEPDLKFGKGYIKALKEAITEVCNA